MRELTPADMPESFEEFTELEEAEELLEPLGFVLNRQLERMMMRLIERSLATDHLEITMALEVHPDREINASICAASKLVEYQRVVKLPVPTQDSKVLLKLLQLDLAAHPPEAPVKKIKIIATPARVRFAQAGLFQPLAPEPAKLEIAMARIRAVVGETDSQGRQKVGCPALLNSHRPDNFQVLPANGKHERTAVSIPHLALRRFRPAIPARVELGTKQAPMSVGFAQKRSKVLHASGPWRGGGEWWDAAGQWMREEWDVSLTIDGHEALYRIFLDLVSRTWFVDGSYD
jgi:protein ImuB